jgi:hypothetical protein
MSDASEVYTRHYTLSCPCMRVPRIHVLAVDVFPFPMNESVYDPRCGLNFRPHRGVPRKPIGIESNQEEAFLQGRKRRHGEVGEGS